MPADATDKSVSWLSSNSAVASVSSSGVVTGVSEGTAIITASSTAVGVTATCTITVTPAVALPTDVIEKIWSDVGGSNVSDIPVKTPPNILLPLPSIEITPRNVDNYGVRIKGFLIPPTTGDYTFYIASDDHGEFWLSSDDQPINKAKLCFVSDWTNFEEWNKYPTQQSALQTLTAGKKYYFEALMKQAGGGDNLSVGWTGPGITGITVIGAPYLEKYVFVDSIAPSAPTNLVASNIKGNAFNLTWNKSTDNNEVYEYVVYVNGDSVLATSDTTSKVAKLTANTTYSVTVKARDASGNLSATSAALAVTTSNTPVTEALTENFDDGDLAGWTGNTYTLSNENQQLKVIANKGDDPWVGFDYHFNDIDISAYPYITFKIKSKFDFNITVAAGSGAVIDAYPVRIKTVDDLNSQEIVSGNDAWQEYTFDFTGVTAADLSSLDNLHFLLNAFGSLHQSDSTIFYMEDLRIGKDAKQMASLTSVRDVMFSAGATIQEKKLPIYGITDGSDNTHAITITAVSDNPSVVPNPMLDYVSPSQKGYITVKPNANVAGTANITLTVSAQGVQDKISTFKVVVLPNQAPSLQPLTDLVATIGQQVNVPLSAINDGDEDEDQLVNITATSSNDTTLPGSNISVTHAPASTAGTLSFTSATGIASGATTTITVKLKDDAGVALGGTDSSSYTFNVSFYNVVNNSPAINNPGTVRLLANTQPASIPLTGITDGDNGTQNLTFTITQKGNGIGSNYVVDSVSNGAGVLDFNLNGIIGADTITIKVTDDGGAGNNGPQSYETTFIIIANPAPQTWYVDDFNDATLEGWSGDAAYTFIQSDGELHIKTDIKSLSYPGAFVDMKGQSGGKYIDVSGKKYLSFKMKALPTNTNNPGRITIALLDDEALMNGSYQRSMLPVSITADGNWHSYTINYNNIFYTKDGYFLDSTHINGLLINIDCDYFNAYTGDYFMDDLKVGDSAEVTAIIKNHIDPVADVTLLKGVTAQPIILTGISNDSGYTPVIKVVSNNAIISNIVTTPVENGTSALTYSITSSKTDSALITVTVDDVSHTNDIPDTIQFKIFVVDTATAATNDILITSSQTYQTIIGMGNTVPTNNAVGLQTTRDVNVTLMRVFGDFDGIEPQNDNSDPNVLAFDKLTIDESKIEFLKNILATTNSKQFFYTPLTPPVWMKNNKSAFPTSSTLWAGNNKINSALYDEYAEFLVAIVRIFKEKIGTDLYAISLQNEPEFNEPYPSCQISGDEFRQIIKVVGDRFKKEGITTRIMMPEDVSLNWVEEKVNPVISDTASAKYLDILAVHNYGDNGIAPGGSNGDSWTATRQYFEGTGAKDLWMTETSGFTNKWEGELTEDYLNPGNYFYAPGPFGYGGYIYSAFKFGHISAWVDLVSKENDKSIAAAFTQFSKFVVPGSVMINATSSNPQILSLAFTNIETSSMSVILFNTSYMPQKVKLNGSDVPAYMQAYITANNVNFKMADSAINGYYLMPARSIVTLTSLTGVLPVTTTELKAKADGNTALLTWGTYNEVNNKGFYIERSADGINFSTPLGFANSKAYNGNSSSYNAYTFVDPQPVNGYNYYRLNQVDISGKMLLSNIAKVKFSIAGNLRVDNIYPNPLTTNQLTVSVHSTLNDRVSFVITDVAGRKLIVQPTSIVQGVNKFTINTSRLLPGIYFFTIISSHKYENGVQRFVIGQNK